MNTPREVEERSMLDSCLPSGEFVPSFNEEHCYYRMDRTRGQVRSDYAKETGEAFTDVRIRKVWVREMTPDEAREQFGEEWGFMECDKSELDSVAVWKVE